MKKTEAFLELYKGKYESLKEANFILFIANALYIKKTGYPSFDYFERDRGLGDCARDKFSVRDIECIDEAIKLYKEHMGNDFRAFEVMDIHNFLKLGMKDE